MTADLPAFLLARVAEDEAAALAERSRQEAWAREHAGAGIVVTEWMIATSPARVLAQCAAIREVVTEHADYEGYGESCQRCADGMDDNMAYPCPTLRALATVWADHPDYRPEEWA